MPLFGTYKTTNPSYFPLVSSKPAWKLDFSGNVWDAIMDILTANLGSSMAWTAPTLLNGWTNFGSGNATAAYMIDAMGFVHVRGVITGGTPTDGTTLFTLPAGFRPPANVSCNAINAGNHSSIRIDIGSTGDVKLYGMGGAGIPDMNFSFSVATTLAPMNGGLTPQLGTTTTLTPGASPYTYTDSGTGIERLYISGGSVTNITQNGGTLTSAFPLMVVLFPGESITVTYDEVPTMVVVR
jgi:hypothetical protein